MKVIGITGPTGAGKTTALRVLERHGVRIIDCDAVYHQLLKTSHPMLQELRQRFGDDVFAVNGELDRKALGRQIYGDAEAMQTLSTITHRYVGEEVERLLALAKLEKRPAAAIDAIALIEGGVAERCDVTVAILAPAEQRLQRIMAREGISEEYAWAQIKSQKPDEFYRTNCIYTVENDSDAEALERKIEALYQMVITGQTARPEDRSMPLQNA